MKALLTAVTVTFLCFSCTGPNQETQSLAAADLCTCMEKKSAESNFKPDYAFAKCSQQLETQYNFEIIQDNFAVYFPEACPKWGDLFRQVIKNELRY